VADLPRRPDLRADGTPIGTETGGSDPRADTLRDGRPKVTWSWWEALLAWFVANVVVAQFLVGGIVLVVAGLELDAGAATGTALALTAITTVVGTAGLVVWLRWRHPGWRDAIRLVPAARRFREWAIGYALGFALYPAVALGAALLVGLVLEAIAGRSVEPPEQISTDLTTAGQVLAVVVTLLIAPVAEEFFFRGILFRSIRDRHGFWPGAIVSSVLFGLAHFVAAPWPDTVFLQAVMVFTGLGLCAIYEWRGNLLANVATHMAFNSVGIVLILVAT
jgi:membrane protease YdiL (CAAX protease family)